MPASSQDIIDAFWNDNLMPRATIVKPPSILPKQLFDRLLGEHIPQSEVTGSSVSDSYNAAVKKCESKVAAIVAECRRKNTKYTDPHFDLDDMDYCLNPLTATTSNAVETRVQGGVKRKLGKRGMRGSASESTQTKTKDEPAAPVPACAKRVGEIFVSPRFFVNHDAHVKDIRQGAEGDCWFISSLGCLTVDEAFPRLMQKICPNNARDEEVGVYGFVFNRDGEWISEVVDDKLYLTNPDYDDCNDERRSVWDRSHSRLDSEALRKEYKKQFQTGSDALFFGSCASPNETWVPLIEKAFAKAHGDYEAIDGGWPGEGVEDLTGGVTTAFVSADILDKDQFWTKGFMKVGYEFIFNSGTREYQHPDPTELGRQGIEDGHAYSLLRATEYKGHRLCLVKNPWGETEWNGPWSDGSKEWTPEALDALDHEFGNEGIFWMPYEDFLTRYDQIWRTRLFTPDWNVTQHWTTVNVPWSGDYNDIKFEFTLPSSSPTVIVLSQLDSRYFYGLTGQYNYTLAFRLHLSNSHTHIVRGYSSGDRSATTEVFLDAGTYDVFLQIAGYRDDELPKVEDVVKQNWLKRRDKLMRVGLAHDLVNLKGMVVGADDDDTKKSSKRTSNTITNGEDKRKHPKTNGESTTTPAAETKSKAGPEPEAPWNASCVVGLKLYTHKTVATTRCIRQSDNQVLPMGIRMDVDDAVASQAQGQGQGQDQGNLGKLTLSLQSLLSSSLARACGLRKLKVTVRNKKMKKKKLKRKGKGKGRMKIKWKARANSERGKKKEKGRFIAPMEGR